MILKVAELKNKVKESNSNEIDPLELEERMRRQAVKSASFSIGV